MTDIRQFLKRGHVRDRFRRAPFFFRWACLFLLAMFAVALFGMSPFSAMLLVARPSLPDADFVFIADPGCGQCFREAANRTKSGEFQGILLNVNEHQRLVLLGAILPMEALGRQKLINDGIRPEAIQFIQGIRRNDWDAARLLDAWLDEHHDKRVRVLCDLFSSRRWSLILDRTLAESRRSRAIVQGITDPRYDETNWWRRRTGLKVYFYCLFRLIYARWHGEDPVPLVDWSPEKYESAILQNQR